MITPNTVMVPDARPYAWPCIAPVAPQRLALMIIDMQRDFCSPGGYIDSQGVDLSAARATIEPIQHVLAAFRALPDALVIHTREGHRPELADLPDKVLHSPWTASKEVLEKANIKLGKTYPHPMIDHSEGRARALEAWEKLKTKQDAA